MHSNVFFDLGYVLLAIGLLAAVPRGGLARRLVVVLVHLTTALLVVVTSS